MEALPTIKNAVTFSGIKTYRYFAKGDVFFAMGYVITDFNAQLKVTRSFKRFKEGIEERKLFLKHQQTVDPHARAPQVVRGLFGCPYTNF